MSFRFAVVVLYTLGYICLISGVNPLIPMINPVHRTIISRRGSNVTLVCLGRNVEVLDTMAVWKFKGREIKDNTNKKATEKWLPGERGNFTLHITNVSQRDVGKYTCSVLVANFNKADAAEGFMKLKLFSSVRWPAGTYALPMADSGCPRPWRVSWSEGSLQQNTEDTSPLSNWSRPIHLKGHQKNNEITQHFCVKENKGGSSRHWPAGKYCIYKKGKCPHGFSEGRIKWDDEDTKNDNLHTGILPDGTYGKDTVVYFCCRSDGSAEAPIELPMRDPFFLLKHSSKCQAVMGMRVTEEWLFWDCEDKENKNLWSGNLPESLVAKDIKLYFCYYSEYRSSRIYKEIKGKI